MKVCLSMIVRDESKVIARCLNSVKSFIDYWVISDTGSVDDTKEIIRDVLKDIPGELLEHPWKNFGWNRTVALQHAKGDYALTLDADEVLECPFGITRFPEFRHDAYFFKMQHGKCEWDRVALLKLSKPWRYEGVLHEYATCDPEPSTIKKLPWFKIIVRQDGARSQGSIIEKYARDAEVLEKIVEENPSSTRDVFYLAQSYRDSHQWEKAVQWYLQRAEMGGWEEEIFYSLYMVARCLDFMNDPNTMMAYLMAWKYRPTRAEPLIGLSHVLARQGNEDMAKRFYTQAKRMKLPSDLLFVTSEFYA